MNKNIYFITGGGTGGHIYPAIAVADEILQSNQSAQVYYVGNPNNLEAEIVRNKNYIFLPVKSSGMPRKIGFSLIKWALCMFFAWIKCCYYVCKYKPDVVFGTGGYVSAPVLFSAITMGVPFFMHDCDANPGLVTRKLSPYAKGISIAFEAAKAKLNNKDCRLNGNPIRTEFKTMTKKSAKKELGISSDKLTLCIMGGSQGAKTINNASIPIIKKLSKDLNLQVIFQTGKKNYDDVVLELKNIYPEYEQDKNLIVRPYFDNMVLILKAADIAVSRAGSLSISELCASGVATIYIPYPYAAADHQRKNAKCMLEAGAGIYLEDSETNSQNLLAELLNLINNPDRLQTIQNVALSIAKYDGVYNIVEQINE